MPTIVHRIGAFLRLEDGPSATEYAVLLGIIAFTALVAMAAFGQNVQGLYLAIQARVGAV